MPKNSKKMPIPDEAKEVFEAIRVCANMALLQGEFDGKRAVFIVSVDEDSDGLNIQPLAIMLDDNLYSRCTLDGDPLVKGEETDTSIASKTNQKLA